MSIKEIAKHRILEQMVSRVRNTSVTQPTGDPFNASSGHNYCAMIVDDVSLRVLSSCCKVYDILEKGVTVVENILKKRQPLPQLDSIYFLSPNMASVECLCRDFANESKPQYKSVHLFFTTAVPPKVGITETIAKATGLLARLKTFVEFHLGFMSYEPRVFHIDMPDLIPKLFPPRQPEILKVIADKLLSFCVSLGDKPNIRFHRNNHRLTEQLASILHQKISKVEIPGISRGKTNLLILDRSIDLPPLLLHEYTYQACIYDLFDVPVCTPLGKSRKRENSEDFEDDDTIDYPDKIAGKKEETRIALLSDADDVYVRYRHVHVDSAVRSIPAEYNQFMKENAAGKISAKQKEQETGKIVSKKKGMTNEEMQAAISEVPQFNEVTAKLYLHMNITQRCIQGLNQRGLNKFAPLEMELATGVEPSGKEVNPKKILSTLGGKLLADPTFGMEEKLRLILLYLCMIDGVNEVNIKKMKEEAHLPLENMNCVDAFLRLKLDQATTSDAPPPTVHTHKLQSEKQRIAVFKKCAKNADMPFTRFHPYIKDLMEQAIQGSLHGGQFPYVAQISSDRNAVVEPPKETTARAVRARDKDWDCGASNVEQESSQGSKPDNSQGENLQVLGLKNTATPPLVVFVLGGVAMSEMRAAYEVSRQLGCEVFIGGTSILTPKNFLASLKQNESADDTQYWEEGDALISIKSDKKELN